MTVATRPYSINLGRLTRPQIILNRLLVFYRRLKIELERIILAINPYLTTARQLSKQQFLSQSLVDTLSDQTVQNYLEPSQSTQAD